MFKLNYGVLRTEQFQQALLKIIKSADYKNMGKLKKVAALAKQLDSALSESQKQWIALAEKYIQKSENGNFAITGAGPTWIDGVDPLVAKAAIDEFLTHEVIIEAEKLTLADIDCVALSPSDVVLLDAVLKL